ncbi:MAG: bifunctional glutamate N-acetyltransferase/amino-acid acetyltransferase ArgJ [Thomasclavelia sp.]|jgi:glutamate N-acetyltransferase/amino-acid N-acetyltransferase|nr:bifunctional glutamate N-acetyltransferase/amino-acid acetyltransferase ArgJ [Thomasclavelia sp.]
MKILEEKTLTYPKGFKTCGLHVGIKKDKDDFALIYSDTPCNVAGTFTTNVVKAAPVLWDQSIVNSKDKVHAIAINSGIANACTGQEGIDNNEEFASIVAGALEVNPKQVLICSTGVIGKQLPTRPIKQNIDKAIVELNDTNENGLKAANAILTTDTKPKHLGISFEVEGVEVHIAGMCKGSGMIHPNMATMLGFITTDLNITKELLLKALREVIPDTFNMISVDRDTSTNDTVLLLSNGLAGNKLIDKEDKNYEIFKEVLLEITKYLAKCIAGDGEGATKLFEVNVSRASSIKSAKTMAKSICTSPLVKTAIYGNDANWGRLLCALGYSGEEFDPYKVNISITSSKGTIELVNNGMATDYSEEKATDILNDEKVIANVEINNGSCSATAWGCDLTYDYVKINADYRS